MTRTCPIIGTSSGTLAVQNLDNYVPKPSQNMVSSYKHKTKENLNKRLAVIFNEREVILLFKNNNWPEIEARKFYTCIILKKCKTEKWQIRAKIFVKNNYKLEEPKPTSPISGYVNRIRQTGDKSNVKSL